MVTAGAKSTDLAFGLKIADIFSKSFEGYELCSFDQDSIKFPLVKIKSRVGIYQSLPFSWHSAIKLTSASEGLKDIMEKIKPNVLNFCSMRPVETAIDTVLINSGFNKEVRESDMLPIRDTNFDDIFKDNFSSKNRGHCRKALNSGMVITKSQSAKYLKNYYSLYEIATKKWNYNTPPYSYAFFEMLIQCEEVDFWVSTLDEVFLGGIIILKYDGWLYHWAGMINREYSSLCINNGLLYEAIKYYTESNQYNYFDFGTSNNLENVKQFKESFGSSVIAHYYYEYQSPRYKYLVKPLMDLKLRIKS